MTNHTKWGGIDVGFFNEMTKFDEGLIDEGLNTGVQELTELMRIYNGTVTGQDKPTAQALGSVVARYLLELDVAVAENKDLPTPLNIIVLTELFDGVADDEEELKLNIEHYAKNLIRLKVPKDQLVIQFLELRGSAGLRYYCFLGESHLGNW